jgi:hypothetical protein
MSGSAGTQKRARTAEDPAEEDATAAPPLPPPVVCLFTEDSGESHTKGYGCYGFLTLDALVAAGGNTPLVRALADVLRSEKWRSELDLYPCTPRVQVYGVDGSGTISTLCGTEGMGALLEAAGSRVADAEDEAKFDLCSTLSEYVDASLGTTGADTIPAAKVLADGHKVVACIDVNLNSV